MEYSCHVRAGAPSCYLELLEKLQKQICRIVGSSLAASLDPLAHCGIVASVSLFYSFSPRTAKLWNSLPIECFPLTYDLSGFKSRINRHLLAVGSFYNLFCASFLLTPCLIVAVQLGME